MIYVGVVITYNYRVETLIQKNLLNLQLFEINLVMHLWILLGKDILFHDLKKNYITNFLLFQNSF